MCDRIVLGRVRVSSDHSWIAAVLPESAALSLPFPNLLHPLSGQSEFIRDYLVSRSPFHSRCDRNITGNPFRNLRPHPPNKVAGRVNKTVD